MRTIERTRWLRGGNAVVGASSEKTWRDCGQNDSRQYDAEKD